MIGLGVVSDRVCMVGMILLSMPWMVCFCGGSERSVSSGARFGVRLVAVSNKLVGSHWSLGGFGCPNVVVSSFVGLGCWTRQLVSKLGVVIVAAS
jgi:hypothetical protein